MSVEERENVGFVQTREGRLKATLISDRKRHRILRVSGGLVAKIVKGSKEVRQPCVPRDQRTDVRLALTRSRFTSRWLARHPHPGLLRVHERVIDENGDEGFLCEELLFCRFKGEGASVAHPGRPDCPPFRTVREFLEHAIRLCEAVQVFHDKGKVHGDLTPSNVGWRGNQPVVIDYESVIRAGQLMRLSMQDYLHGTISCTPSCCSPEHLFRVGMFPTTDVYCLGWIFLSWISGYHGVMEDSNERPIHMMAKCQHGRYPHWGLVDELLPEEFPLEVLHRAVRPLPEERYLDARAFGDGLQSVLVSLSPSSLATDLWSLPPRSYAREVDLGASV